MAWDTSSVAIGRSTKKADYDRLRMNDQSIASGTFTFYGVKTWKAAQVYDAAVKFNAGVTGTCTFRGKTTLSATCVYYSPVLSQPSMGTLHIKTSTLSVNVNPSSNSLQSADVSSFLPAGAKGILFYSLSDGGVYNIYSDSAGLKQWGTHAAVSDQIIVALDANRKYYWKINDHTLASSLTHTVVAYFI